MVKQHISSIYSALAAVLVAAAFAFMCIRAPFVYAANTYTSSVVNEHWNSTAQHFGFSNIDVQSAAYIVAINSNLFETRFYKNPTVTINSNGSVTCKGDCYVESYNTSTGAYSYNTGTYNFIVYSTYIHIQRSSSASSDYYMTDSSSRYVLGFGLPSSCYDEASVQSANHTLYENRVSSGSYGFNGSYPNSLSSPVSADNFYNSYIKNRVDSGVIPDNAYTTTTTSTTTTSTTTTSITLATFPYQTNPPFELPSEWLGDYSETVPVPSVPAVTTVDVSGYDDILTDAENNFVSAIGFWFLAMKDFLSLNPTITYLAVFTIAIVLIILLLYNKGDDS